MEITELQEKLDQEHYEAAEKAYLEQTQRQQRQYLLQLKMIDDLDLRTEKLGDILTQISPVEAADLVLAAYELAEVHAPIGEAVLLSALQLDVIWKRQGMTVLQGMLDELRMRSEYDLLHILLDSLIFRDNSHIFCLLANHFGQLSDLLYQATADKRFHLDMTQMVRQLQELCKKQGLQFISMHLDAFFETIWGFSVESQLWPTILPIILTQHFSHLSDRTIFLDVGELLPDSVSNELIPTVFDMEVDINSWELILTEAETAAIDDLVIEARKRFENLRTGERVEIARKVKDTELKLLLYDKSPIVIEALLDNPRLTEVEVGTLTNRQTTAPEILAVISQHNRWICRYPIKFALVQNPNTPFEIAVRQLPDLLQADLITTVKNGELNWNLRRAAYQELQARLEHVDLRDQLEMVEHVDSIIIDIFLSSRDERIVSALIYHNRLKEHDIIRLISWHGTSPTILERIGKHPYWSEAHAVKVGLLHQPATPPFLKSRFMDDMTPAELDILSHNPFLDESFLSLVQRRLEQLQPSEQIDP